MHKHRLEHKHRHVYIMKQFCHSVSLVGEELCLIILGEIIALLHGQPLKG